MQSQFLYIALAVVLALLFQPLRRVLDKLTDRIFFRDRYDTQIVLNALSAIMTSERILDELLHDSLGVICRNLRLRSGQFVVFKEDGQLDRVVYFGAEPTNPLSGLDYSQLGSKRLVADKLAASSRHLHLMEAYGIQISTPMILRRRLVGFLLLGNKRSGSVYSRQDLNLIEVVGPSLAVAISNAQAYQQIAEFNVTLQKEVRQATAKLSTAYHNLKQLDKTKDEFLSIASHQLRTPLASIKGNLSMLSHGDAGQVPKPQQELLQSAIAGANRMGGLVMELLNISSLDAGRFILRPQPVDLVALTESEVQELSMIAKAKGIDLALKKPTQALPPFQLDESRTRQIIMNLIDNAIFYTQKGEVTVAIEADGKKVRLTVSDTGIGVPKDSQAKLFTKFFRAPNARQLRPDGTGVGLYLVKWVVEAQGGKVIFSSSEKGSTFGFEQPFSAAIKAPVAEKVEQEDPSS